MSVAIVSEDGDYETFVVTCDRCHNVTSSEVTLRKVESNPYAFIPLAIKKNKAVLAKAAKLGGLVRRSAGKHLCKECNAKAPQMKQLDMF